MCLKSVILSTVVNPCPMSLCCSTAGPVLPGLPCHLATWYQPVGFPGTADGTVLPGLGAQVYPQ